MDVSPDNDARSVYTKPLAELLAMGETRVREPAEWRDYVGDFGLGPDHVADLIRMVRDDSLNHATDDQLLWAPVHAWRALAQLRATEAIAPLLDQLRTDAAYDDMVNQDYPAVFGMIGPEAIAAIDALIVEATIDEIAVNILVTTFAEIGKRHPESRAACVDALQRVLTRDAKVNPVVNGFALSALLDLDAREALDAIRAAFERDVIDHTIAGDMEDVEIAFGLRETRSKPRRKDPLMERFEAMTRIVAPRPNTGRAAPPDHAPTKSAKIGRNDPCPCGSGKKYKKCCMT
jgi:hypothetical protein